jgi:hypothetical protein
VFLIGIADHVGPLVMHRIEWRKERKKSQKPHSSTKQISLWDQGFLWSLLTYLVLH